MTDKAILAELGGRFRTLRLRRNWTQQQLADRATLSVTAIKSLEAGHSRLATAVAVLRELRQLDALNTFIPPPGISPMQLAKLGGKPRQRASGTRSADTDD